MASHVASLLGKMTEEFPHANLRRKFAALALAIVVVTIACYALWHLISNMARHPAENSPAVNWDFSTRHDLASVQWPSSNISDDFHIQGDVTVRMVLDKDHVFEGHAAHIYCKKRNGRLQSVTIDLHPESLADAYAHAYKMMEYWGIKNDTLGAWRTDAASGHGGTFTAVQQATADNPVEISLEIGPAVGPFGTDCHLMLQIFWEK
jgi:hypothetical protein